MKELFAKYQIEIIKPNVDYLIEKYKTAYAQKKELKDKG